MGILPRTFIRSFVQLPSSLLLFHPSGKHWRRRAAGTSVVALQVSTSRQPRPSSALARTIHETNRHTQDTRTTRARRPTPSSAAPHSVSTKPTFQSRTPSFLNPDSSESLYRRLALLCHPKRQRPRIASHLSRLDTIPRLIRTRDVRQGHIANL